MLINEIDAQALKSNKSFLLTFLSLETFLHYVGLQTLIQTISISVEIVCCVVPGSQNKLLREKILAEPGFEHRAAGWEARTLLLCEAQVLGNFHETLGANYP